METSTIALFDMDDTLFDHNGQLNLDLEKLRKPEEEKYSFSLNNRAPEYIILRARGIRAPKGWWANLPKFQLGWDIWDLAGELGFHREILTRANIKNPNMWIGKVECIVKNFNPVPPITITSSSKSRHYGRVLIDDYPPYVSEWLNHRPRGLVIMPAQEYNKQMKNPQIIRYDGTNLNQVREAMQKARLS